MAELADLYLPIRVGSDTALLLGMAHVIAREGLVNEAFMRDRTTEGQDFLEHVKSFTPEWAAEICEVPAEDIEKAGSMLEEALRVASQGGIAGPLVAQTNLNLGVVYVGGLSDRQEGLNYFIQAGSPLEGLK